MAEKRKKLPQFTTPKGSLKWPKLHEPDYGNDQYPDPDGSYKTKLVLKADDKETKALLKALQPLYAEAMALGQEEFKKLKAETRKKLKEVTENQLFTELLDQETEKPTGEIEFSFKMKASGKRKHGPKQGTTWTRKPVIFDAKGKPMVKVPAIYSGTTARVAFEASPYFVPGTGACGLKLGLVGVQVIDLVNAGGRSAESLGFGAEEGYEYDESDTVDEEKTDSKDAASNDEDDENVDF